MNKTTTVTRDSETFIVELPAGWSGVRMLKEGELIPKDTYVLTNMGEWFRGRNIQGKPILARTSPLRPEGYYFVNCEAASTSPGNEETIDLLWELLAYIPVGDYKLLDRVHARLRALYNIPS